MKIVYLNMKNRLIQCSLFVLFVCSVISSHAQTVTIKNYGVPVTSISQDLPFELELTGSLSGAVATSYSWSIANADIPNSNGNVGNSSSLFYSFNEPGSYIIKLTIFSMSPVITVYTATLDVEVTAPLSVYTLPLAPVDDAYLRGNNRETGSDGNFLDVRAANASNGAPPYRAYLKFDISNLIGNFTNNAELEVTNIYSNSGTLNVYLGDSHDWTEGCIGGGISGCSTVAETPPNILPTLIGSGTVVQGQNTIPLNLGALTGDYITLVLESADEQFYFNSKDNTGSFIPLLKLELDNTPSAIGPNSPTIPTLEDAFVRSGSYANTNYGNIKTLRTRAHTSANASYESFLKFDLSSLSAAPSEVKLRIYLHSTNGATANQLKLVNDDSWTEGTITWNNKPAGSTVVETKDIPDVDRVWVEFDVTNIVASELAGDQMLSLQLIESSGLKKYAVYRSSEYSLRPYLVYAMPQTISPLDDAFVRTDTYADNNYGNVTNLRARVHPNANATYESFIKFDLSSISPTPTSVKLMMYMYAINGVTTHEVYNVSDDSWDEGTITWNNKPASGSLVSSTAIPNVDGMWVEYDVTTAALAELAGDRILSLRLAELDDKRRYAVFRSSEYSDQSLRPYLFYETSGSAMPTETLSGFSINDDTNIEIVPTEKDYTVALSPNPAQEVLNINLQNYMDMAAQYMIVSLKGEVLLRGEFTSTHAPTEIINVRNLPDGNYFIHIAAEKQATIAKSFVIMK